VVSSCVAEQIGDVGAEERFAPEGRHAGSAVVPDSRFRDDDESLVDIGRRVSNQARQASAEVDVLPPGGPEDRIEAAEVRPDTASDHPRRGGGLLDKPRPTRRAKKGRPAGEAGGEADRRREPTKLPPMLAATMWVFECRDRACTLRPVIEGVEEGRGCLGLELGVGVEEQQQRLVAGGRPSIGRVSKAEIDFQIDGLEVREAACQSFGAAVARSRIDQHHAAQLGSAEVEDRLQTARYLVAAPPAHDDHRESTQR
jgi:hypothetical protein